MTRNTMASCIQRWLMCGGSPRLHQTNPFLFAISLTEQPKKSRRNTNSIPRVEGFWLWGGWWETCRATTLLKQNPFLHSQTVIALLCSPCGSVSPKQLVVQSHATLQGRGVAACIVLSINLMIVHLYQSQQVYSTSIHVLFGSVSKQNNRKTKEPVW